MSLNWKEIELVLEELAISGSFVQNIVTKKEVKKKKE
jgi:hypothetical protein